MSNKIIDMTDLQRDFKDEIERAQFIEHQHHTISTLINKNKKLIEEVEHLKKLLLDTTQLIESQHKVERVILTAEEALIEGQIEILKTRSYLSELTLEDVKKLDLLLKNKSLVKNSNPTIEAKSSKVLTGLSKEQLILIASKGPNDVV